MEHPLRFTDPLALLLQDHRSGFLSPPLSPTVPPCRSVLSHPPSLHGASAPLLGGVPRDPGRGTLLGASCPRPEQSEPTSPASRLRLGAAAPPPPETSKEAAPGAWAPTPLPPPSRPRAKQPARHPSPFRSERCSRRRGCGLQALGRMKQVGPLWDAGDGEGGGKDAGSLPEWPGRSWSEGEGEWRGGIREPWAWACAGPQGGRVEKGRAPPAERVVGQRAPAPLGRACKFPSIDVPRPWWTILRMCP